MRVRRATPDRAGRRLAVGACLTLLLTLPVGACAASPEDEVRTAVEGYVALLEAGKAEAADALDTYDPATARCPELFTDAVYGEVPDRPSSLAVTEVRMGGDDATVLATITLGEHHDVPVELDLVRESGTWLIDNHSADGAGIGVNTHVQPGEMTVQGACRQELRGDGTTISTEVYPGSWTVAYADPAGVGQVEPVTVTALGTLRSGPGLDEALAPQDLEMWPTVRPEAVDAVDEAVATLLDDCVAQGYVGDSCPYNRFPEIGPSAEFVFGPVPPAAVEVDADGTWRFAAWIPVTWQDERGFPFDHTMLYRGGVTLADDGTAVLTLDRPGGAA